MALRRYLADTSAITRLHKPAVAAVLEPLLDARQLAICAPVEFELRFAAPNPDAYREIVDELLGLPGVPVHEGTFREALDTQARLAERGQWRALSMVDLLVAAAAHAAGLTVLHYEADFDLVAETTGQPTEWVVAPGDAD